MTTKIQKWGNSQGLRLSKEILEFAHLSVGDLVSVIAQKQAIVIKPVSPSRGKYNLQELIARMPKSYKSPKEEWGVSMGKEVW